MRQYVRLAGHERAERVSLQSADFEIMRRRKEWFERMQEAFTFQHPFPAPDAS